MRDTIQQKGPRGTTDARANGRTAGRATQPDEAKDREMGSALRSVYQRTVEEQIPDDLLDLLGKLS